MSITEYFELVFTDYTLRTITLGTAVLGAICGMLGSFAVLRKQSLLGDAISHAALPGIAIAFLITGAKDSNVLMLGALVSGLKASCSALASTCERAFFVTKEFAVGAVGVNVHAVMYIGDGVDRAVEQQLTALFCLAQVLLGNAPLPAGLQVDQFAVDNQRQQCFGVLWQGVCHAAAQGAGAHVDIDAGLEQNQRYIPRLPLDQRCGVFGGHEAGFRLGQAQIPVLLQAFLQVFG